jgi:hypothetical protein
MARPVRLPDAVEPLARFVEETPPGTIVRETVRRLQEGVPEREMITAAALAVMRSTEMPFVHHGGPLHPVAALPAVEATMDRMPEGLRWLPLIQDVALANRHIHDPTSGPSIMPEIAPLGAGGVDATVEAFRKCLGRNYTSGAEHHFLWLLENAQGRATEALLRVAVENYRHDEHKLIAVVNALRLLDRIGWRFAPILLRGAVRYNFMPSVWAKAPTVEGVEALIERHGLKEGIRYEGEDADDRVAGLRRALVEEALEEAPERIAVTLRGGMSLQGAAEAVSLAASDLFIRMETANAMGIHFMTGANAIRWVCRAHPPLGARALLMWALGPETLGAKRSQMRPVETPGRAGLEAVTEAIRANDGAQAAARAAGYLAAGGDARALLGTLGMFAGQDDSTEMHALKHHQAMAEEFEGARPAYASAHLVAQAKEAALHAGKGTGVYEQAREALRG